MINSKYCCRVSIPLLLSTLMTMAQSTATSSMYVDYQQFFGSLQIKSTSVNGSAPKPVETLRKEAALLTDEKPVANASNIPVQLPGTRILDDEAIYTRRKKNVFIIGNLKHATDSTGAISFELTGTAFALSPDGLCATNYHVLKNIIEHESPERGKDSVFFIMTLDNQVYFIDSILAYSQNNDLAVFRVNTNGRQLQPIPFGKPAQVGATVYCISHPLGYFYYFSKGIVARNVTVASGQAAAGYNPNGKPPIRMEITADYGIGSSGGPILDKYGNLVGIVSSTAAVGTSTLDATGNISGHQQMVVRDTSPLIALKGLLGQ